MHTRFVIVSYFSIKRRHIWYYNRSFDVCVSGVRSGAVSCECVCVSCEWASRRSSVVRREAFSFALRFVWDSEIFDSNFEFKFLEFSCRISNSSFSFEFAVEFSIRVSSSSSLNFRVEFRIRLFRFVALFDFSKSIVKFDFSNFDFRFEFRIQVPWVWWFDIVVEIFVVLLYSISRISIRKFRCSIRLLEVRLLEVRLLESSPLNFEFVLIYSTSRTLMIIKFSNLSSKLSFSCRILHLSSSSNFATFVARRLKSPTFVLNCKLTSSIILARALSLRSRCHASFARAFRA